MDLQQVVQLLDNLLMEGEQLVRRGQYYAGLDLFTQALTLIDECQRVLSEYHDIPTTIIDYFTKRAAICHNDIGFVYRYQGNLSRALEFYEQALVIDEAIAPNSSQTATCLNNIGRIYQAQGNLSRALELFQQALVIDRAIAPNSIETATRINNIGFVYSSQGELNLALEFYKQALAIDETVAPTSLETARDLNNIGGIYQAQGNLSRALEFYKQALAIDEAIAPISIEMATDLNNLGFVYSSQGDHHRALEFYEQALAIDRAIAPNSAQTARDLNNIGGVYQSQGNLSRALEFYKQALVIDRGIAPNSIETARNLDNIGVVYQIKGNLNRALRSYRSAIEIIEVLRLQAGNSTAREGLFARKQNPYYGVMTCCLSRNRRGDAAEAFAMAERTRARTLVERLNEKNVRAETPEQQALLDEEQRLLTEFVAVSQRLQNHRDADVSVRLENTRRRAELDAALKSLETRIRRAIPAYGALQAPQPLDLAAVRRGLVDPNALLLSFCMAGSAVIGWAVRGADMQEGVQMFAVGGTEDVNKTARIAVAACNLLPRISAYLKLLNQTQDAALQLRIVEKLMPLQTEWTEAEPLVTAAWQGLAKRLWEQIRPEFKQGVTRLIVLPDGDLNALPFEMLPDGDTGKTLGATYAMTYAPSATALDRLRDLWDRRPAPSSATPAFLGFGDPDFDSPGSDSGSSRTGHARLPGTGAELREIALHFSNPVTLYDRAVTKANIAAHLEHCTVLHGATHGLLNNDDPLGSGLVLAGGDVWEARELLGRRHPLYLELMVASACDTGRGGTRGGEGLVGFSAALMAVGVKCAIVSLWPVDDNATYFFMKAFYNNWQQTRSVQEALKAARSSVQQHPRYPDPYFWAGFIAVGIAW